MRQLDRYVLRQLAGPFLFFVVIFGGILWLNQALRIVDVVINNGQSGLVFAELSAYLIPKVLETVVPVAAFASAVYLINRLYSEAEFVVFMGVGVSPADATRPYFLFGGACFLMMTVLVHLATPFTLGIFAERQHQISQEYLTQFVVPGEFTSPDPGVTIFFGETTPEGALNDVLINDRRGSTVITHTAAEGQILSDPADPKLILFDGTIQRYTPDGRRLSTIQFESLSYDLSQFARDVTERAPGVQELFSWELLGAGRADARAPGPRRAEFHDRLVKSLLSVVVPVLGAIALISAGFSRSGFFPAHRARRGVHGVDQRHSRFCTALCRRSGAILAGSLHPCPDCLSGHRHPAARRSGPVEIRPSRVDPADEGGRMTLYLYFGRRFLGAFLRVFAILTLLLFVIETLEKIRGLSRFGVDFLQSMQLAAFSTPALVLQALPIIVMLAGLTFCVGLARSNEFVVSRAVGVPALRAMGIPALYAVAVGLAAILFLNPLAASFSVRHDILKDEFTGSANRAVSFSAEGFWLRQRDEAGHTVIHAEGRAGARRVAAQCHRASVQRRRRHHGPRLCPHRDPG